VSRVIVEFLMPLLLPAIVFLAWVLLSHRRPGQDRSVAERLRDGPWTWLIAASILLLMTVLGITALTGGAPAGAKYRAPHLEDGKVVPGTFE
jgi:hypothetical protein